MRLQLITCILLFLRSVYSLTTFQGKVEISELNKNVFDPSRASIVLTNGGKTERYHFTYKGDFEIPDLSEGSYLLEFESKDFDLKRSNLLYVVIDDQDKVEVYETLHGNAITDLSLLTKLEYPLRFPEFTVRFKDYIETKPNGLNSLPFIGFVRNNPIITLLGAGVLLLGLMPHIISYFDPEFAARVAESNREANAEKEGGADQVQTEGENIKRAVQTLGSTSTKPSSDYSQETIKSNKKTGTTSSSRNAQSGRRRK